MDAFDGALDFYTGSCLTTLEQLTDCLADLTGADGCLACDAIAMAQMENCPLPSGCL